MWIEIYPEIHALGDRIGQGVQHIAFAEWHDCFRLAWSSEEDRACGFRADATHRRAGGRRDTS